MTQYYYRDTHLNRYLLINLSLSVYMLFFSFFSIFDLYNYMYSVYRRGAKTSNL